jgi:hypothetical protein
MQTGWDRQLQSYYLCISNAAGDPVYSTDSDHELRNTSFAMDYVYVQAAAARFGTSVPGPVVERVVADARANAGNAVAYYDQAGREISPEEFRDLFQE